MLNRQVRQIYPQQDKDTQTVVFSDYSHFPNIVLLGDLVLEKHTSSNSLRHYKRQNI